MPTVIEIYNQTARDAYQLALAEGFTGTRAEWLASLVGGPGDQGSSAYEVAVANGFGSTRAEWLASLVGEQGSSAYQVAVANGFGGTEPEWLASLVGEQGPAFSGDLYSSAGLTLSLTRSHLGPVVRCSNTTSNTLTITPYHATTCPWVAGDILLIRRATGAGALAWNNTGITVNSDAIATISAGQTFALQYVSTNLWDFI